MNAPIRPVSDLVDGWLCKQAAEITRLTRERDEARAEGADLRDPRCPLLSISRGNPWTPSGFGASWRTELIRLKLRPARNHEYQEGDFAPTFHGLPHTNATQIANTVAQNPDLLGGIQRVKSKLGHHPEKMAGTMQVAQRWKK